MKVIPLTEAEAQPLLDLTRTWLEEREKEHNAGVARHKAAQDLEFNCCQCQEGKDHGLRLSDCGRYLVHI